MLLVWFAPPAAAAPVECDAPVEKSVVEGLLVQGETAVNELDPNGLAEAVERARLLFRCVEEPFTPAEIARTFRLSGISRYVQQDLVGSVEDFEIARGIEPDTEIGDMLGPPLRINYDAVPPPSGEQIELPRPAGGVLLVDGVASEVAPADRAYVVQWVEDETVRGTWVVAEGEHPGYPARGSSDPGDGTAPGRAGVKPLLVGGLASGALAVGGIVGAALLQVSFDRSEQPSSALRGQIAANRALGYGGIGLGAVGLGLVGTSLVVEF
jgi:hypothetical protein